MYVVAAAAVATLGGCSQLGSTFDSRKGFLDPTAVGRFQKQPLVVNILSSLDRNVDVADARFANATDVQPQDLQPGTKDYTMGRNDLVTVAITDLVAANVETTKMMRVSESGTISLPLVGQVKAVGLTEAQLEREIAQAYRQAQIIQNAQVSVSVTEARARTFSIIGAVAAPGQYAILNSDFRVLDALVLARDINQPQGIDYLYVVRQLEQPAAPSTAPAAPAVPTGPSDDVLTPRSQAQPTRVILAQAAPTTTGISGTLSSDNEKIISVEGKPLTIQTAATTPSTPAASVAAPTVPEPTPAPVATARPAPVALAAVVTPPTTLATKEPVAPVTGPAVTTQLPVPAAPSANQHVGAFEFSDPVAEGKTRVIRVPFTALRNGDLRYNIIIKPYDMIIVPQPIVGEYYMGGHVARSGVYNLSARNITLKQAIVSAGGFDQLAVPAQTDIVRRVGEDHEIFVKVDIDKVFAGEQPDIFLRPNDIVQVGTSWWAPFVASVRGGMRVSYGFGFLYDRNFGDPQDPTFGKPLR